jgi:importin subunit beta-1
LVAIGELYYDKIGAYVQRIYELTTAALQNPEECEDVKLQAMEFWASLADAESEIQLENEDARAAGADADVAEYFGIVQTLFPHLAPIVLAALPVDEHSEPDDLADADDWTLPMAAAVCLKSVAACIEDAVVAPVLPFVQQHIGSEQWRLREAAVMAFGSILEGPQDSITPTLPAALPELLRLMVEDPALSVRDTTAWAVGVVCQLHPIAICQPTGFGVMIERVSSCSRLFV